MSQSHIKVRIKRVDSIRQDVPLPSYATAGSSGMDVHAALETEIIVKPGESTLVPSGFIIEIPVGFEGQVRPRSGLAIKHNIGILNSPGTIDSDYRGEVKIILTNFGKENFTVKGGDRIAQLVIVPVVRAEWEETATVEATHRGSGGFGHTGR